MEKTNTSFAVLGFVGAMSLMMAGAVHGGSEEKTSGGNFSALDVDHDGYISMDEAEAHPQLTEKFGLVDENMDSKIDEGEFAQFEIIEESTE